MWASRIDVWFAGRQEIHGAGKALGSAISKDVLFHVFPKTNFEYSRLETDDRETGSFITEENKVTSSKIIVIVTALKYLSPNRSLSFPHLMTIVLGSWHSISFAQLIPTWLEELGEDRSNEVSCEGDAVRWKESKRRVRHTTKEYSNPIGRGNWLTMKDNTKRRQGCRDRGKAEEVSDQGEALIEQDGLFLWTH